MTAAAGGNFQTAERHGLTRMTGRFQAARKDGATRYSQPQPDIPSSVYRTEAMRNLSTCCLLAAISFAPLIAMAQPSLCTPGEVTEWSCTAKKKIYSLCSSKDLGANAGYMQYRAGKTSKTEFVFPERLAHPKGNFRLVLQAKGVMLSFSNAGYEYAIHEPLGGSTHIDVANSKGAHVADVECNLATDTLTLTTTMQRFERLGIYR
jgi:hypothetical protein